VPGKPEDKWPWYFIDPATCIDCGACVPECPFEAIFPEGEIPTAHTAKPGQEFVPFGGTKYAAKGGEVVDLTGDTVHNANFYTEGPGYNARNM
jgi:ferredoxin